MNVRSGLIFALSSVLVLGGCAAAGAAGGPVTSPTGKVYEPGVAPRETRQSQAATLYVAQRQFEQALEQAEQGLAADSANPVHYFLAGQAYAGLGRAEDAHRMFERAEAIYPAYELEIEPAREQAWADAFNAGVEAYNAGDLEEAARQWRFANEMYDLRPESYLNLAVIYTQQDDYARAIEAYQGGIAAVGRRPVSRELTEEEIADLEETRGTLIGNLTELLLVTERFAEAEELYRDQLESRPDDVQLQSNLAVAIARQGREAEAQEIYERILAKPDLTTSEMFDVGVALFNARNHAQSAEAFRRVTERVPESRDAWYNYANALYAQDAFADLVPVAERLVGLDPLNENSALILAQAYRQTRQNQKALEVLQHNEAQPVYVDNLLLVPREGRSRVTGQVIGKNAEAGTPIQLRFTFFDESGEVGSEVVTVSAPAEGAAVGFEVGIDTPGPALGYKYEKVD